MTIKCYECGKEFGEPKDIGHSIINCSCGFKINVFYKTELPILYGKGWHMEYCWYGDTPFRYLSLKEKIKATIKLWKE